MLIKYTDKRVVNNPLNPIINSFANLLRKLAELDNIENFKIKKYYTEKTIKIVYSVNNINLYVIKLFIYDTKYYNEKYFSLVKNDFITYSKKIFYNRKFVNDEINNIMKNFVSKENYFYGGGRNEFTTEDFIYIINNINKIIEKLNLKKETNKYNL